MSIVRIRAVVDDESARRESTDRLIAERVSPTGEVIAVLAGIKLNRDIGSKAPRYWYYVGQVAFASDELPLYRHDRMLVLGNDLIGSDELIEVDCSSDVVPDAKVWWALIQAALQVRAGVGGAERRLVMELSGSRVGAESPFWQGLGRHFCPVGPELVRERFGENWSAHVASLLPQQPVLVSLLCDEAQQALNQVGDDMGALQAALVESNFRWCRHVSIYDGGPVYEHETASSQNWQRIRTRAVDGVREGEEWLLRNDDSSTWWLARACHVDDALEIGPDAARQVGCEMAGAVSGLRCPPRMDR